MTTRSSCARAGFVLLLTLGFLHCNDLNGLEDPSVRLDRAIVADMFGDGDGITTPQELSDLTAFFASNLEAWCITGCPADYWTKTEIPATVVREVALRVYGEPYPSEDALRAANVGESIRTPFITISVFLQEGDQITLARLYRSPGPHFAEATWEPMTVIP